MIHALLELIFVALPITAIATIVSTVASGIIFGPVGAVFGALIGLVGGITLEILLQPHIAAGARAKWAGIIFVGALLCTIGAIAITTR